MAVVLYCLTDQYDGECHCPEVEGGFFLQGSRGQVHHLSWLLFLEEGREEVASLYGTGQGRCGLSGLWNSE